MRKVILVLFIFGCGPSEEEKLHLQSVETHDLAIKISEHVDEKIQRLAAHASQADEPLKSLLGDSVNALTNDYAYWQSTIVEVPGHEHDHHDHDHDHAGHDHNHEPPPDLTPEMMLDIQQDLRDRIVKLNIRAQKLLNTLEKKDENESAEEEEKASSYGT